MASYHFSAQVIQRSKGRSAVAAAAYRSGSNLYDERTGERHDYSRRRGVVWSDVLMPVGAAGILKDRQSLWNHAECLEKRGDAQVAREINLALPAELNPDQRRETLLNFVLEAFVARGMVADVAIHAPVAAKGDHPDNHHAHILLSMRRATRSGLHPVKTREWNSDKLLVQWRALWAKHQNEALERAGARVRVDHRTLAVQREDAVKRGDRVAAVMLARQPQVHVGPKAMRLARRGIAVRSVDRVSGPVRRRPGGERPGRRVVRYRVIDKGSRLAFRAAIVRRNGERVAREVQRWQARSMRLRSRQVRLGRAFEMAREDFRRLMGQRDRWQWLERKEAEHSLQWQVEVAVRKLEHARHRSRQLALLLAEVDRTLARLFVARSRPSIMARPLGNRPLRVRPGRSRARYPIASSSATPGSA